MTSGAKLYPTSIIEDETLNALTIIYDTWFQPTSLQETDIAPNPVFAYGLHCVLASVAEEDTLLPIIVQIIFGFLPVPICEDELLNTPNVTAGSKIVPSALQETEESQIPELYYGVMIQPQAVVEDEVLTSAFIKYDLFLVPENLIENDIINNPEFYYSVLILPQVVLEEDVFNEPNTLFHTKFFVRHMLSGVQGTSIDVWRY